MAGAASAVIAPSLLVMLLPAKRLRFVQAKWNNGHVEDRGGEIAASEWGRVCFRRITDHFARVILSHSCVLLHIRLLTTFNSFRASELCKFGWNESSQLHTPGKTQCLFVVHLRGDGIDFFFLSSGGSHLPPTPPPAIFKPGADQPHRALSRSLNVTKNYIYMCVGVCVCVF